MKLSTYMENNIEKFHLPEWFYVGGYDDIEILIDEDMVFWQQSHTHPYLRR